jgi:hypothetical protein
LQRFLPRRFRQDDPHRESAAYPEIMISGVIDVKADDWAIVN